MRRQVSMSFLLLLLYLITVACILEISLGSCWHKDECMDQGSTVNHNVQLFISLNNQYAMIMIIQRPPVERYMWKLCPNQISITIWKFTTWVCIEHDSTAPSPIDPVLTVQPDHCYIFFSLKNTFKNYFINYHNIIHLSLVRRTRQTLKTKPLIMLSIDWQIWENTLTQQP